MSASLNKVMLIGNTGDDVKVHYFEGGNCVGRFPLATNETYTNKNGERVTTTEWHNIVVNNKAAEICEKYLKKGDRVYIEGKIRNRKWTDDIGVERYSTEILCREFVFLGSRNEEIPVGRGTASGIQADARTQPESQGFDGENEDDLPF